MILLTAGYGLQPTSWKVCEHTAPGYSRVYYIVGGDVFYTENQVTQKLHTGHLYLFPANKVYEIRHSPDNCIECLWFHIDFLPTIAEDLIAVPITEGSSLHFLLQAVIAHLNSSNAKDTYYYSLINTLVCFLHQHYLHRYPKRLEEIISYIHRHCMEDLSVLKLSQQFGYSQEYFIRMFRQNVYTTPYQYLLNCKLNEAARLLQQNIPIIQVAQQTGFHDVKTFSRTFKQHYQIAPSQFSKYYHPQA